MNRKKASLTLVDNEKLELTDINFDHRPLEKDEILVEVKRVSLCGSDLGLYYGTYKGPSVYPINFGHEWSGEVVKGGEHTKLPPGTLVTGDCSKWCGTCEKCRTDKNLCEHIEKFGITTNGFSSTHAIVKEKYLYENKYNLPPDVLALNEVFAVALHAVKKVEIDRYRDKKILILGTGSVGMALFLLLKYHFKCSSLYLTDYSQEKMDYIKTIYPEARFIKNGQKGLQKGAGYNDIKELAEFQLIFEASGAISALQQAIDWCDFYGKIVMLGFYPENSINLKPIIFKCIQLIGTIGGTGEFYEVQRFFADNLEKISLFITRSFAYTRGDEAFREAINNKMNLKIQLSFEHEK